LGRDEFWGDGIGVVVWEIWVSLSFENGNPGYGTVRVGTAISSWVPRLSLQNTYQQSQNESPTFFLLFSLMPSPHTPDFVPTLPLRPEVSDLSLGDSWARSDGCAYL